MITKTWEQISVMFQFQDENNNFCNNEMPTKQTNYTINKLQYYVLN